MIVKKGFIAEGTTCHSCEKIIKHQALKVDGVEKVEFSYETETGSVTYDDEKTNLDQILYKIEEKGYQCYILDENAKSNNNKIFGWTFGILGLLVAGYFIFHFVEGISVPEISTNMGYGLLFIVGLLTGFHCVSMCGGFVVSYTAKHAQEKKSPHVAHAKYAVGKLISYTVIGAIFGLIGSIIAFTPLMRGIAGILAGLFLIIFGLNMLNITPLLRKVRIPLPSSLSKLISKNKTSNPLVIGLLNGLMIACGPLQAIYIMAAGTGSPLEGAKLLFIFALGTLPVMLGFGYVTSFLSSKATHKILKASGVIVIILGLIMVNRGLALTGGGYDINSLTASENKVTGNLVLEDGYQVIEMTVDRYGWTPDTFVLQKDVPVKWKIDGKEITGCNNAINVPKLNLEFKIKEGMQEITFTPTEAGTISWSCWMGMIPGTFIVKDNVGTQEEIQQEIANAPVQKAGSCGGSCGSTTCGAKTGGSCGCGGGA